MAKYVIEIPDDRIGDFVGNTHLLMPYTMAGHKGHHDTGLNLTPYTEPDEDEIRQKVEKEVWEFVGKIECMTVGELEECFEVDYNGVPFVANAFSYAEAKAKYEEWQKQKDEIRVGDEIVVCDETAVVLWLNEYGNVGGYVYSDGKAYINGAGITSFTKTGRHFSEVAELLKKMEEE